MTPTLALSALLWLPPAHAQPAAAAALQLRLHVTFQPTVSHLQRDGDREIICGMVVIHKTAALDPKILLPPRVTGASVRRIEPQGCDAKTPATAK